MEWGKYFEYKEGELYWKISPSRNTKVGQKAGFLNNLGYKQVRLKKKAYKVHRVIWEMLKGPIQEGYQIDHINGIKNDNNINNLRLCTNQENMRNKRVNSNSKLQVKGVWWDNQNQKYQAKIQKNNIQKHLGYFNNLEEAKEAYEKAAKELHGEYYNGPI